MEGAATSAARTHTGGEGARHQRDLSGEGDDKEGGDEEARVKTALVYMGKVHTLCREFRSLKGVTKDQAKEMNAAVQAISATVNSISE